MAICASCSPRGDLISFANRTRLAYEREVRDTRFGYIKKAQEDDSTDGGSCSSDLESATSGSVSAQTCSRPCVSRDGAAKTAREVPQKKSLRLSTASVHACAANEFATAPVRDVVWDEHHAIWMAKGNCVPVGIGARLTPRNIPNMFGSDPRGTNQQSPQAFEHMPAKVRPSAYHATIQKARLDPSLPAKKFPRFLADFPNMTLKSQQFDSRAPLKKGVTSFLTTELVFVNTLEWLTQRESKLGCTFPEEGQGMWNDSTNVCGTKAVVSPRFTSR